MYNGVALVCLTGGGEGERGLLVCHLGSCCWAASGDLALWVLVKGHYHSVAFPASYKASFLFCMLFFLLCFQRTLPLFLCMIFSVAY